MPSPCHFMRHFWICKGSQGHFPAGLIFASFRPLAWAEKGCKKMKIRVKYYANDESKAPMTMDVEVAEGECKIMIEQDYQQRKRAAAEGEPVVRRSAQEIIDGEFNRPLYNDWHREHRRRTEFPDYQSRDEQDGVLANPIEYAPDTYSCGIAGSGCRRNGKPVPDMSLVSCDELNRAKKNDDEAVCQTIRKVLEKKPEWADAVIAVFINGESIRGYAARIGANENNVTQKLKRAKKKLKKFWGNRQIGSSAEAKK